MMNQPINKPQVGAPDPELRNSPIFDEEDDEFLSLDAELESGLCYFNDQIYRLGEYVCSGDELLRCETYGVWIREGSCHQK
ncbi:MAG: hypothetical protein PVG22_07385 [Chromatiales bacterium]|jgi:hypothetical protein